MRWILLFGGMVAVLVMGVIVVGTLLPESHTATVERRVAGSPEEVWAVITDVDRLASWRPGVDSVERLPDRDGRTAWTEFSTTGPLTMEMAERRPPRLLVTRIADDDLPFGGTWTFRLEPDGDGTRITVTEDGEVYNPFFRFVARFVMGYDATMNAYLEGLEERMAGVRR